MPASRLTITEDRSTAVLISLSQAFVQAGERAFPKSTATTLLALSRAVRGTLEAQEKEIALSLLDEVSELLKGETGVYVEAVKRKVADVIKAITWKPTPSPTS